jgi:hypothetical protein
VWSLNHEYQATLFQAGGWPRPGPQAFGLARVSVAGDTSITIQLGAGVKVSGRILFEGERPPWPLPPSWQP